MGKYLQEELIRKGLERYIPQMEMAIAEREGRHVIKFYECFYSQFGQCPTNGSRNAACTTLAKSYFDMPKKELIKATEKAYKDALIDAAKLYHIRMDYINNLFADQEEEIQEEDVH